MKCNLSLVCGVAFTLGIVYVSSPTFIALSIKQQSYIERISQKAQVNQAILDAQTQASLNQIDGSRLVDFSMIVDEWDCSTGELYAPLQTLGDPGRINILPTGDEPRKLSSKDRQHVANLYKDGTIEYVNPSCPQMDPPMRSLFGGKVKVNIPTQEDDRYVKAK